MLLYHFISRNQVEQSGENRGSSATYWGRTDIMRCLDCACDDGHFSAATGWLAPCTPRGTKWGGSFEMLTIESGGAWSEGTMVRNMKALRHDSSFHGRYDKYPTQRLQGGCRLLTLPWGTPIILMSFQKAPNCHAKLREKASSLTLPCETQTYGRVTPLTTATQQRPHAIA